LKSKVAGAVGLQGKVTATGGYATEQADEGGAGTWQTDKNGKPNYLTCCQLSACFYGLVVFIMAISALCVGEIDEKRNAPDRFLYWLKGATLWYALSCCILECVDKVVERLASKIPDAKGKKVVRVISKVGMLVLNFMIYFLMGCIE
jgi:hypothetical protein